MKVLVVDYLPNGHRLVIAEQPWPLAALSRVLGWRWTQLVVPYRWWNWLLGQADRRVRPVLSLPVEHGCDVAQALWGSSLCWHREQDGRTEG